MRKLILAVLMASVPVVGSSDVTFAPSLIARSEKNQLDRLKTLLASNPAQSKHQYVRALMMLSRDGFLTRDMIKLAAERQLAQRRAGLLYAVYQNDLDGDGIVTLQELETQNKAVQKNRRNVDEVMIFYSYDLNEDDVLSFHEVLSYASKESKAKNGLAKRANLQHRMLMSMDMNEDGVVTIPEVLGYIDAAAKDAETAKAKKAQGMVPTMVEE